MFELKRIEDQAKKIDATREEYKRKLSDARTNYNNAKEGLKTHFSGLSEKSDKTRAQEWEKNENDTNGIIQKWKEMVNSVQGLRGSIRPRKMQLIIQTYLDSNYKPVEELTSIEELQSIVDRILANGFWAWVKRLLRIGKYSSKGKMILHFNQKVLDTCYYCYCRIEDAKTELESERTEINIRCQEIDSKRKNDFESMNLELDKEWEEEKKRYLDLLESYCNSNEVVGFYNDIEEKQKEAKSFYQRWDQYSIPEGIPSGVYIGSVSIGPGKTGQCSSFSMPLWLNLFASNVVVITAEEEDINSKKSRAKGIVRRLLARMIKTIPPEVCSYSVFDSLHKGDSLGRLVDITNVGTTDINFDLFTSENSGSNVVVSCGERREYLRNRLAEIIKYTAGKSQSLFDYNREEGAYDFPFTWVIDFGFPDKIDSRLEHDYKELFVNAQSAGYSFVLVTNKNGYNEINRMVNSYSRMRVLHIDCEKQIYEQGSIRFPMRQECAGPSDAEIDSFMTALTKFYNEEDFVDNAIRHVFRKEVVTHAAPSRGLTIPMALDSRKRVVNLELGGAGSIHGFISGGTNSGKSTLLHTVILSACMHYDPRDLEIWLVDYKQTEFFLYKNNIMPHIKLIGMSKDPDFTYSLLDSAKEELDRRTRLMNVFSVVSLEDYWKHKGEPGYEHIKRLFIIVDEFHEMSQSVADNIKYKTELENLVSESKSAGINFLLADQSFSKGLGGLTPKARDQIGLRIAMRNEASPQEIKETLEADRALYSDGLQKTITIMSQGDFIMKVYVRNPRGEMTDIRLEKFKALLATNDDIVAISKKLREKYKGLFDEEDLLFVNTRGQVEWDDSYIRALDSSEKLPDANIRLYLGRPATLKPCFNLDLGRQPDENLSIVGGNTHQRYELIMSIIHSCKYRAYSCGIL